MAEKWHERDLSISESVCGTFMTAICNQLYFHENCSVLETPTACPNLAKKAFWDAASAVKQRRVWKNNASSRWEVLEWSHLAIHTDSSGSARLVNRKTITQSKPSISGWGPDQVIVHLYEYRLMLMLTLCSLYSYSTSYNQSDFNKESRHISETFQQHYRWAAHKHAAARTCTQTLTSLWIGAIETRR